MIQSPGAISFNNFCSNCTASISQVTPFHNDGNFFHFNEKVKLTNWLDRLTQNVAGYEPLTSELATEWPTICATSPVLVVLDFITYRQESML
jgi:hypothetical protein